MKKYTLEIEAVLYPESRMCRTGRAVWEEFKTESAARKRAVEWLSDPKNRKIYRRGQIFTTETVKLADGAAVEFVGPSMPIGCVIPLEEQKKWY